MLHHARLGLMALATLLAGQMPVVAAEQRPTSAEPVPLVGPIEVGDVLDVSIIFGLGRGTDMRKRVRVAADGTITPYWMKPVKLVGLNSADAAKALRKACEVFIAGIEPPVWQRVLRVDPAGNLRLPFVGKTSVAGLREVEAQAKIEGLWSGRKRYPWGEGRRLHAAPRSNDC